MSDPNPLVSADGNLDVVPNLQNLLQRPVIGDPIPVICSVSWGFKMNAHVPPEVLQFAPNQKQQDDPIEQVGQGLLTLVQQAANISKENTDRAMSVAHRLSIQLRAAEDRIAELHAELERSQSRAARAEQWLEDIKAEIEAKLIAPIEANRREPSAAH